MEWLLFFGLRCAVSFATRREEAGAELAGIVLDMIF